MVAAAAAVMVADQLGVRQPAQRGVREAITTRALVVALRIQREPAAAVVAARRAVARVTAALGVMEQNLPPKDRAVAAAAAPPTRRKSELEAAAAIMVAVAAAAQTLAPLRRTGGREHKGLSP